MSQSVQVRKASTALFEIKHGFFLLTIIFLVLPGVDML